MALSFPGLQPKKRSQVVAIDLGSRFTKAVYLQRKGTEIELANYCLVDTPAPDRATAGGGLAEHLKRVMQELGVRTRQVVLAVGVQDCVLRHAEMPLMPVGDMRQLLRFNAKNYLQQDFAEHVFDCFLLSPVGGEAGKAPQKCRTLIGASKRQTIADLQSAVKAAGLVAEMVVPGTVGPANAFELGYPEVFTKEVVALIDLGYKNSTINILDAGQLLLNRVVSIGGEKLTTGLAEAMSISSAEAEGMKLAMPEDVQMVMMMLLQPLAGELHASLDFYEHQHDKTVSQTFISGGAARSEFIVKSLKEELSRETKAWNPLAGLRMGLSPEKMGEVEQVAPQLAVAAGAALSAL